MIYGHVIRYHLYVVKLNKKQAYGYYVDGLYRVMFTNNVK